MGSDNGYIKLYRSVLTWDWYDNPNAFRLFIHLLLTVNWKDGKWHGEVIKRGQRLTSVSKLAAELGISTQSIRTAIKRLISTGEITTKATNKWTLITVENYEKYQSFTDELTSNLTSNATSGQQTTNKQLTTNEKEKEIKEFILNHSDEEDEGLLAFRNEARKIVSENAKQWRQEDGTKTVQ